LLCAGRFGHVFACGVLGRCFGVWFLCRFGVKLRPGIVSGFTGVFRVGGVVGCRYVWGCLFVFSLCLPVLYVIAGIWRWYSTGTPVRCICVGWYVCGVRVIAGLPCFLFVVLRITVNCSDV